ncbi:hypothetical protein J8655_12850 [Dickeya oryzae]|uniref:Uncharacterized protein n=1 Tax=Dickeya oryzae TaxID=1240404 RepID=A0AB39IRI0_9GAMM|nr:hypothetical protein [Dickeya oryzae]MBP2846367.1 hypothetical protein [Dickeya oryzae]MCA6992698.1 hypothetical protein [Dickeya oryzae]
MKEDDVREAEVTAESPVINTYAVTLEIKARVSEGATQTRSASTFFFVGYTKEQIIDSLNDDLVEQSARAIDWHLAESQQSGHQEQKIQSQ